MRVVIGILPVGDEVVLNAACCVYFDSRLFDAARHAGTGRIASRGIS